MIKPFLQDQAFLDDVAAADGGAEGFHLWWLGQSGYLLKYGERHLLLDPYLSDSLTRKYAATDKPHVRMTERVVAPERLAFVDVVTSSHNHTDHLDAETLLPLLQSKIIIPEANRAFVAERLGIARSLPLGLTDGETVSAGGFSFTGVPAAHNDLETDSDGRHRFMGYLIRFGPWTVYHSGDTLWYDGLVDRLKPTHIDVALLPINGNDPARRVAGNLDGREAVALARAVGARLVIPCHYDLFTFNTVSPRLFEEEAKQVGQPYRILQAGERWSSAEPA